MDLPLLQKVVTELSGKLMGARIGKIHQPAAELFVFRLWTGRENLQLLISTVPQESRIHLTDKKFPNPFTPPRFCQLLRARISRITSVALVNDDRIVQIEGSGPKGNCRLMVELTGQWSNLVLVDERGKIIDVLKRHGEHKGRQLIAAEEYHLPAKSFELKEKNGSKGNFTDIPDSISQYVEKLYSHEKSSKKSGDLRQRISKIIGKEKKKLRRRLKKISQEKEQQENYEHYRQIGDLLLASLQQLKRGMDKIELINYYVHPPTKILVDLNSKLNGQMNAEQYFKKYKKARRGIEHSVRRTAETEAELSWLEQLEYQLQMTDIPAEIADIANDLKKAGLLKEAVNKLPRSHFGGNKPKVNELLSPNGFRVLWGTSSRQNDLLSTRELKKGDIWFHVHQYPGSHVVLKSKAGPEDFGNEDIRFAASLAARYSKAKNDDKVEVIVAEAKAVHKPAAAKPGMVTVKQYKTLIVQPLRDS